LEQIYNPPPQGCAEGYLHGHVMGEQRRRLLDNVGKHLDQNEDQLSRQVQDCKNASNDYDDAKVRFDARSNLPHELEDLANSLKILNNDKNESLRQLHYTESEIRKLKGDLHTLNAEIGRLTEQVAKIRPEQKRIAVAERVHRVLDSLLTQLKPLAMKHLERAVTRHFRTIIDQRFKDCTITIPDNGSPELRAPDGEMRLVETMSGFEKRSFGIAFSLALAELTQRRLPLVIDTPLGNADSEYRPRLLKALTDVKLDQIIMLTHDEEVNGKLFTEIEGTVSAQFLVKFDNQSKESKVYANAYFGKN
jgi:DNA sulfur modification protein DndD